MAVKSFGRVDSGSAQWSRSGGSGAAPVAGCVDSGRGFQVRAAGLRADFPALRALDTSPGNLRLQPPVSSGAMLSLPMQATLCDHRVVTLTGVGGAGKTRLAQEVAAGLADEFPDGVWFFELAAVADPAAVPDAVAAVLGITQQPGKSVSESVAAALEGRSRLPVFDNCEHVVDSAPTGRGDPGRLGDRNDSGDQPRRSGGQRRTVMAGPVARRQLRDRIGRCEPFRLPCPQCRVGLSLAQPGDADVSGNRGRLDGIPLAIELAASRMASMTAREVRIGSIIGSNCWSGPGWPTPPPHPAPRGGLV